MSAPIPSALRHAVAEAFAFTGTEWGSSRWSEFRRCPQAHNLRYVVQLRRKPESLRDELDEEGKIDPLTLGNLVHSARGYVELHHAEGAEWQHVIEEARARGYDPLLVAEAERLLAGYFAHWGTDNAGWPEGVEIVDVERLYSWPLNETLHQAVPIFGAAGNLYTARLDTLLLINGSLVIADTKTRARSLPKDRAHYERGLRTNPQFLGQSWLVMQAEGLETPPPVWVNAIVKTKIPAYDRLLVRFTRDDVEQWAEAQRRWYAEFAARGASNGAGCLMNYSACAPEMGSRCWAFDWCHGSEESRALHFETAA
jgi:hypothetical protein